MSHPLQAFMLSSEPFYQAKGAEVEQYRAAYQQKLPVLLKGPTGCGKPAL